MIRVLHVDDDKIDNELLTCKIHSFADDITIHWIDSAHEALGIAGNDEFDCILSDYQMPLMNGLQFLSKLRDNNVYKPFIFLTGQGDEKLAAEALRMGADDYYTKDEGFAHYQRLCNSIKKHVDGYNLLIERKRYEKEKALLHSRIQALWGIANIQEESIQVVSEYVLKQITSMTQSRYGFYGLIDESESVMTVYSCSAEAMQDCRIKDVRIKHPIENAGVWADAIRKKKPVLVNDYSSDYGVKKEKPIGHVDISRLLSIPVFSRGRIVALGVVANKSRKYSNDDVLQLQSFLAGVQLILDRKQDDEALRQSEKKYRTLFQETQSPIMVVDENGKYIDANNAALDFLECERQELLHKQVWDYAVPGIVERQQLEHAPFIERRTVETEYFVNGKIKTLMLNVVPVRMKARKVLFGIGLDITEHKKTEEALMKNRIFLKHARSLAQLGSWEYDIDSDFLTWSDETFRIFRLDPQSFTANSSAFFRTVHPDDRDSVENGYFDSLKSGQDSHEITYRIVCGETEDVRTVHSKCDHLKDSSGQIVRSIGVVQDITDVTGHEDAIV